MRSFRIAISRVLGKLPALVAAGSFGAAGCVEPSGSSRQTAGSAAPPTPASGASAGASGEAGGGPSEALGGGAGSLPPGCARYMLDAGPAGVRARRDDICTDAFEPVVSNAAARVALMVTDGDPQKPASGSLVIAPSLDDFVRDVPVLSVVASSNGALLRAQVSALEPTVDGYSFVVTWPAGASFLAIDTTQVSFRAELDLGCDFGSRLVHATTVLQLCGGSYLAQATWAADGGLCVRCYQNQP